MLSFNYYYFQLKRYMQMIENYPELRMGSLKESELHHQFSKRLQVISKGRDHLGRRIFIFRAGTYYTYALIISDQTVRLDCHCAFVDRYKDDGTRKRVALTTSSAATSTVSSC
jgi:hypothetical protein